MALGTRIKRMINAFRQDEERVIYSSGELGASTTVRLDRARPRFTNERSIIASIYNRMCIDVAGVPIRHVDLDEQDRYVKDRDSELNMCLKLEANIDQGPRAFRQDIVATMFDHGSAVIVPVDRDVNLETGEFDCLNLRVGNVVQWYPRHLRVNLYNEVKGLREDIIVEKRFVAVVENPLYSVMNEQNSTLQRLIRKLALLDVVDEQSGSGKLDLIIQLPYVIKSEAKKNQAEQRRKDIEFQLKGSQYGIAYTDGTEKITQLNRPAENNLLKQVEFLMNLLYSQLGLTPEVMNGTADEATMLNYFSRTVEPILDSIVEAMRRSLIGRKRSRAKESIRYFRDPFKLIPLSMLADIADVLARNEVVTSNEIRSWLGIRPADDPKADQLVNSNMPQPTPAEAGLTMSDVDGLMNEVFDGLSADLDKIAEGAGGE